MYEFAVLAEGLDVHTNDFCCQWHYVLVGGMDFGWMNIWGLQRERLDNVGCKPVWTSEGKGDSFGQRPSRLMTGVGPTPSFNYILAFAWQLRKNIGLPKSAICSSFCRLGRFAAWNLDRPAISRRLRLRPLVRLGSAVGRYVSSWILPPVTFWHGRRQQTPDRVCVFHHRTNERLVRTLMDRPLLSRRGLCVHSLCAAFLPTWFMWFD